MIDAKTLNSDIGQLLKVIERQFGIEADDLQSAMRKIGRRLPKSAHRHARTLIEAQAHAQNPKIALQLDEGALKLPYAALLRAVEAYNRKDARWGLILSTLGSVAFNVIAICVILIVVLRWRGFL